MSTASARTESSPVVQGTCYALFAYDIGFAIRLDEAERYITPTTKRDVIKHTRRAPPSIEYLHAPLRITQEAEPLILGDWRTQPDFDIVLYDFGAVFVNYSLPFHGPLDGLLDLTNQLYNNAILLTDSRRRVEALLAGILSAVTQPHLADLVEDYVILEIREMEGSSNVESIVTGHAQRIAQILRSESGPLSDQEVQDALSCRISYSPDDATLIDWNAAILMDRDAEDLRRVLEFANVELLEMRFLDGQLDRALDESYEALSGRQWQRRRLFDRSHAADLYRLARLQADNAVLFEGVNNALKLLGDQYLARVYRLASQRFHLSEWDASILRKLGTLESTYQKIANLQANRRMEVLEWIIILLFVISIVIPFLFGSAVK